MKRRKVVHTITLNKKSIEDALAVTEERGRLLLGELLFWSLIEEAIRRMLETGGDRIPKKGPRRRRGTT